MKSAVLHTAGTAAAVRSSAERPAAQSQEWDFSDDLEDLRSVYDRTRAPIATNFRKLVSLHSGVDRYSHLLHAYPAKLLLNIPLFFLNCRQFSKGILYDPFCGSGTVLLEGLLAGWSVGGADANPLARLITAVKLSHIDIIEIEAAFGLIIERYQTAKPAPFSPIVDVNRWFSSDAQNQIGRLSTAIDSVKCPNVSAFFKVCLSACLRRSSYVDPRLSVPVRVKEQSEEFRRAERPDVVGDFGRTVFVNMRRLRRLHGANADHLTRFPLFSDARAIEAPPGRLVDLIVTSPPYVGAQKYVRASSLSLGWLGLAPNDQLRPLERLNIGREHYPKQDYVDLALPEDCDASSALKRIWELNRLRAHIAANYLIEMAAALRAAVRCLSPEGHLILVIGNNTICGEEFDTRLYLTQIAVKAGLQLELELEDDIRSRGLMTKRNVTAGMINREHILVLRRLGK